MGKILLSSIMCHHYFPFDVGSTRWCRCRWRRTQPGGRQCKNVRLGIYAELRLILFLFLEDFKREDMAAALVDMSINDTVQTLAKVCVQTKVKRVFVCGSYANRDFMRKQFTYLWAALDSQRKQFSGEYVSIKDARWQITNYFVYKSRDIGQNLGTLWNI